MIENCFWMKCARSCTFCHCRDTRYIDAGEGEERLQDRYNISVKVLFECSGRQSAVASLSKIFIPKFGAATFKPLLRRMTRMTKTEKRIQGCSSPDRDVMMRTRHKSTYRSHTVNVAVAEHVSNRAVAAAVFWTGILRS
nr:hypothetical protein CFP56_12189 [Quercus suber]